MQVPLDYLSKTFLQCSKDLIPSWLNMPFWQTALLLLTPALGLTRNWSDPRFSNQQTTMYFPFIIYQSYVTALAIPFFWGIQNWWRLVSTIFPNRQSLVHLDTCLSSTTFNFSFHLSQSFLSSAPTTSSHCTCWLHRVCSNCVPSNTNGLASPIGL